MAREEISPIPGEPEKVYLTPQVHGQPSSLLTPTATGGSVILYCFNMNDNQALKHSFSKRYSSLKFMGANVCGLTVFFTGLWRHYIIRFTFLINNRIM